MAVKVMTAPQGPIDYRAVIYRPDWRLLPDVEMWSPPRKIVCDGTLVFLPLRIRALRVARRCADAQIPKL